MIYPHLIFEKAFLPTSMALYINGSHPYLTRNVFRSFQFLIVLTLSVTSFVLLTNSFLFHDIPDGRFSEASKTVTMALVAFTITAEYIFLLFYRNYLINAIAILDRDYVLSETFNKEERNIVLKYSKRGTKASWCWLISSAITGLSFPVKAMVLMCYYHWQGNFKLVPMFDMTYPHNMDLMKDIPAMYILIFAICFLFGLYATTVCIGFDPLVPIFLLHICGQLDILSKRMSNIFAENTTSDEANNKLKKINIKLQEIYDFIDNIKSRFTILFEYNMKITTFLLPLATFQVVEDLRHHNMNFEFVSFFVVAILHFYMPCYYSDELMDSSGRLREAVYTCGWEKQHDIRARRSILIMLTRTRVPLCLSTVFYPICLDTFAEMCRQAYAIFNIMNAAWA